ncbi:LOW QUALITY PROTEIN: RxLR effector family [Phytophthora palmivora]|uniref:RxLR effector family n=1 Tax=Phytophthora palmivora TaxID=4796 RepID=A0A2P4XGC9_9STRA|nr:LOW QUALITY PROTEIN: RxLR effector family [Phytophthora palmivora]
MKLRFWLGKEKSALDVLDKLELNSGVIAALTNPKLKILDRYVTMLNNKYTEKQVSLLGILTARYDEVDLAMALALAKYFENSKPIATKLQRQQLQGWLNAQKSVDDVFSLLRIKEDGIRSMLNMELETMSEYIKMFNSKNPQQKTDLFTDGFGGEDKFAILVTRAMAASRVSAAFTYKFQKQLLEQRIKNDYDPMTVLIKTFKIDEHNLAGAGVVEKSVVNAYKSFYNSANGLDQMNSVVVPRRYSLIIQKGRELWQ